MTKENAELKGAKKMNEPNLEFRVITNSEIIFEKIHEQAKLPTRKNFGDSCFDFYSVEEIEMKPGEMKAIPTGLKWQPSHANLEIEIRPRSGLAVKHGITVLNSPGTIDASYRGEIKILLINHGTEPYVISVGERVAQGKFNWIDKQFNLVEGQVVTATERGEGGFGSTGKF